MEVLLTQTARMTAEVAGLQALVAEQDWLTRVKWALTAEYEACAEFDITIGGKVYEAVLVYPDLFPHAPAFVRPRQKTESWSGHQYLVSGVLCLEWGPDNWQENITGADLVVSAHKLLAAEAPADTPTPPVPSRHVATLGQQLRGTFFRFVVLPGLLPSLQATKAARMLPFKAAMTYSSQEFRVIITKVGGDDAPLLPGLPKAFAQPLSGHHEERGWLIHCADWKALPHPSVTVAAVEAFLKSIDTCPWTEDKDRPNYVVLVNDQLDLRPISLSSAGSDSAAEYTVVPLADVGDERQPERNGTLSGKKVAIVGAGSVGSKIAISLARCGVDNFMFIDDDVMEPANLQRHGLDWDSIGYAKVDALKVAIERVAPNAKVTARNFRFTGQESPGVNTKVLEQVAACDLVIDATADPKVFSLLAAICTQRKVSMVWGEMFAGGLGAMMARSIKDVDADPLVVRASANAYLAGKPEAPFKKATAYDVEHDGQIHVAGDSEVTHLAASMTQFAIDALVPEEHRHFPQAVYLFGYRQAWIFDAPFHTHAITCPTAAEVPSSNAAAAVTPAEMKALFSLFAPAKC